jgi:hypothetical protein
VVEHVKRNKNPSRRRRSWSGMAGASGDTAASWRSRAERGKRGEKLVCVRAGERTRELCWAGLVRVFHIHDRVCTLVLMEQHLIQCVHVYELAQLAQGLIANPLGVYVCTIHQINLAN